MLDKEKAREWVRSVVGQFLPKNSVRFSIGFYNGEATHHPVFGFVVDPTPVEGRVIAINDDWTLLKIARTQFFVFANTLLSVPVELNQSVRITPYARRRFDGKRIDTPDDCGNGVAIVKLGGHGCHVPVNKEALVCDFLRDMVNQVEQLPAGDGMRTLAHVLVDAGAHFADVEYIDPNYQDVIATPPTLRVRVRTLKHDGYLEIVYDRGMDYYHVNLLDLRRIQILSLKDIDFTSLAETVIDLVDDGRWRIAQVEIIDSPKLHGKRVS